MSDFKVGDKALLEVEVEDTKPGIGCRVGTCRFDRLFVEPEELHHHPGVPVAEIVKEVEELWSALDENPEASRRDFDDGSCDDFEWALTRRAAREAADEAAK